MGYSSDREVVIVDQPMPLIDIGIERIDELLRSVIDAHFEDTIQDAWVRILDDHVGSEDDILRIARDVDSQHARSTVGEQHRTRSLDAPIGEHKEESPFTLKDILEDKTDGQIEDEISADEPYQANSSGKFNTQGHVNLDQETICALRNLYPHDPISHIVRRLAYLPPAKREKRGWHKWEDAIIIERYGWGGARAVAIDVHRTETAIVKRAKHLHVLRGNLNGYKPCPDLLNIVEVAEKTGLTWKTVDRYIREGVIEAIRIPHYHQGHDGVFITPESLDNYINRKDIIKQERIRKHVKACQKTIAERKLTWRREAKVRELEAKVRELEADLLQQKKYEQLEHRSNINTAITELQSQPSVYKVAHTGDKTHWVFLDDDDLVSLCNKVVSRIPLASIVTFNYDPFVEGLPTCKRCLTIQGHK